MYRQHSFYNIIPRQMFNTGRKLVKQEQEREANSSRASESNEELFEVESIVKKKVIAGKIHYMIKWIGYPHSQNTWQPVEHLESIQETINEFQKTWEKSKVKPKKATLAPQEGPKKRGRSKKNPAVEQRDLQESSSQGNQRVPLNETERERIQEPEEVKKEWGVPEESKIQPFPTPQLQTRPSSRQPQPKIQPQIFEANFYFLDEGNPQQANPLNKSFSFNDSSSQFVVQDSQTLNTEQIPQKGNQELRNLKSLRTYFRKQQEDMSIPKRIAKSEQLLELQGAVVIQVSQLFCEVKLLSINTGHVIPDGILPFKTLLEKAPRLLDMKIGEALDMIQRQKNPLA